MHLGHRWLKWQNIKADTLRASLECVRGGDYVCARSCGSLLLLSREGVAEHYLQLVDVGEGFVVKLEVIVGVLLVAAHV